MLAPLQCVGKNLTAGQSVKKSIGGKMSLLPAADGHSACQALTAYLASWIFDWFASSWVSLLLLLRTARSGVFMCSLSSSYDHQHLVCAFCLSVRVLVPCTRSLRWLLFGAVLQAVKFETCFYILFKFSFFFLIKGKRLQLTGRAGGGQKIP